MLYLNEPNSLSPFLFPPVLHGFIFHLLACWAQNQGKVTLTNLLPTLQGFPFTSAKSKSWVNSTICLQWVYWELLDETILLCKNYKTITVVIWRGWERTIIKLAIGYLRHFLSEESKWALLRINTVESKCRRQDLESGREELRVNNQLLWVIKSERHWTFRRRTCPIKKTMSLSKRIICNKAKQIFKHLIEIARKGNHEKFLLNKG